METDVKLTKLAKCAGCGAKVGAGTLAGLLGESMQQFDEKLLVGFDKSDDACVYAVNGDTALVQTVDFFPPVADDPFLYGMIAAANAISDIYAMGAEPKLALNILGMPEKLAMPAVKEILRGGYKKAIEAGAMICGGHTIFSSEPLYGLAVTGFVDPKKILTNSNAKPGDALILTKKLGVGIILTAIKAGLADKSLTDAVYAQLIELNKRAAEIMRKYQVHSCTDITGFGLLGHCCEMAQGSKAGLHLVSCQLPVWREAYSFADMGLIPEGAYRNREYCKGKISGQEKLKREELDILYDPQTSGGLMFALPEKEAEKCLAEMSGEIPEARIIGYVSEESSYSVYLE